MVGGQTVAEWMAAFMPVVTARQRPTEWPPVLVLDSTRFRWNNHGQTYDLFSVLGAYGYDGNGEHGRLWKLASAPANADNWKAFLDTLPGRPLSVVCDRDLGIIGGVQRAWGRGKKAVPIHLCEYHLITKGPAALGRDGIGYGHPTNELLHQALATPAGWDAFAHAVYRSCKRRGMRAPVLAVGDGALGFWKAIREVFPDTAEQRCWFHLASNVLAALPKSADPGAKAALAEIWGAEDKDHALAAVAAFEDLYGAKWPKATAKITDHVDTLLAFYDYPAEHWIHLRTTNPIESTFATVRLRQRVTKGPGSRAAGVAMAFKLLESAQARWRAVNAPHLVALVRAGARFEKGKLVERPHEPGGDRQVA